MHDLDDLRHQRRRTWRLLDVLTRAACTPAPRYMTTAEQHEYDALLARLDELDRTIIRIREGNAEARRAQMLAERLPGVRAEQRRDEMLADDPVRARAEQAAARITADARWAVMRAGRHPGVRPEQPASRIAAETRRTIETRRGV